MSTLQSNSMPSPSTGGPITLRQLLLVSGLITAMLLCGCASRAHWKKEAFALDVPSGQAGSVAHTNVLLLHRVTVSPLFDGQPLVYRTGENSYERDPYAEFFVTPNRMLEQCLRKCLRNGHAFADVLDPGSSLKSSCSMEVSTSQLYGDFRQTNQPFAVLQLRFLLYSTEPANLGRVIWQREFSKRLPLTRRTPAALVAGWNAGLQQIMEEANTELRHLAVPEVLPPKTGGRNED
ncbi:MAG: uncharacterized protein JWR26_4590 [Pedosphaera sp.]|nr:uncharacterized protein [Pedosphaera sp.]